MYRVIALLAAVIIMFSSCAPKSESMDTGLQLRQKLVNGDKCTFKTEISADFGDKEYSFVLSCEAEKQGVFRFAVVEPEVICGISGVIDQASGKLTFDDVVLSFPILAEGELPPVCAPYVFYKALSGGYLRAAGLEDGYDRLTVDDSFHSENISVEVWLKNGVPIYAEVIWQGRNILSLKISEFHIV